MQLPWNSAKSYNSELIDFNVNKLVRVRPSVLVAATAAIDSVWRQYMHRPTSLNLTFAERVDIPLLDGSRHEVSSVYEYDIDRISIAVKTLSEDHPEISLEDAVILHAGHEARHKVQVALGDIPTDSNKAMADGTYIDSRHEVEAWQSAVDAYGALNLGKAVGFTVGSNYFTNAR